MGALMIATNMLTNWCEKTRSARRPQEDYSYPLSPLTPAMNDYLPLPLMPHVRGIASAVVLNA